MASQVGSDVCPASDATDQSRDALWAIHGCHIQDLLQREQGFAARDLQPSEPNDDDPSF